MSNSPASQTADPAPEFDEENGCYERTFNTDDQIVTDLVMTLANISGDDPESMPPLQESIDTAILERLLAHDNADSDARLSFTYYDFRVTVWNDGDTSIHPLSN
ncbi:HalOD1 output domain-containing protein [Halobacterium zhouii]|uniref:HalOD1 output domain-containing protein n=1 Tax=Halobacterium zhouii TaxID=2902624 RepID=UPI001E2AC59E|nr:HalOD1 output domain-containing protein [Halobacterium zhouii]